MNIQQSTLSNQPLSSCPLSLCGKGGGCFALRNSATKMNAVVVAAIRDRVDPARFTQSKKSGVEECAERDYYAEIMKRKIHSVLFVVLFACVALVLGDDSVSRSEEKAFSKLSLRIKEERLNGRDCEELGFVDKTGGKMNVSFSGGHESQVSFDNDFEGRRYQLSLRNNEPVDLVEMSVECRFFYLVESVWRTKKSDSKEEMKHKECSFVHTAEASSRGQLETEPFVVNSHKAASGVYYGNGNPEVVESKPKGLWVKVTYTTSEGQKLERDFCEPKTLSNRVSWDGTSN